MRLVNVQFQNFKLRKSPGGIVLLLALILVVPSAECWAETLECLGAGYAGLVAPCLVGQSETRLHDSPSRERHLFRDLGHAGKTFVSDAVHIYTAPARLNTESALRWGGILALTGAIYAYDQGISDEFKSNRERSPLREIVDTVEPIESLGHMGKTNIYYFGTLTLGYILRIESLTLVSAQILESLFIAGGVKNLANVVVGRRRPHEEQGPRSFKFNDGTSFPSGHASNLFQVATVLSHHVEWLPFQVGVYSLAAAVALQRVTSEGHWPSDVFLAAAFGRAVAKEVLKRHDERDSRRSPKVSVIPCGFGLGVSGAF